MVGRRKHVVLVSLCCTVLLLMVALSGYKNTPNDEDLQTQQGRSPNSRSHLPPIYDPDVAIKDIPLPLISSTQRLTASADSANSSYTIFTKSDTNDAFITKEESLGAEAKVEAKFEISDVAPVSNKKNITHAHLSNQANMVKMKKLKKEHQDLMKSKIYPQLMKAAAQGAKHRVVLEYNGIKGDPAFKPGYSVPNSSKKRILILTTWRSGSTFLGDIFNAYPGTFYSFEPLHMLLKRKHFQEGPEKGDVLGLLKDIMNCNMKSHGAFFDYAREKDFLMSHNSRYWLSCSINRALCFDPNFFNQICDVMPVNVMKTVRMGAKPVADLITDPDLNLKVIHLVRDPRGTLQSRKKLDWCQAPICSDPKVVCDLLMEDLGYAEQMQTKFPDKYLLIRYEDLSTRPHEMVNMLLEFAGLMYTDGLKKFVTEHTKMMPSKSTPFKTTNKILARRNKKKYTYAYSTFRDSKSTVFKWRNTLNYTDMSAIQDVCTPALDILNFRVFKDEEEYKNEELSVFLAD